MKQLWMFCIFCFALACKGQKSVSKQQERIIPYTIQNPDKVFDLPVSLTEISGLGFDSQQQLLVTHNDEQGILFYLSPKNGEISSQKVILEDADYEGIEYISEQEIYLVRSKGNLIQINPKATDSKPIIYKSFLNKSYDIEGLAYDKKGNQLLLACKEGGENPDSPIRNIYSFDLVTKTLNSAPYLSITPEMIQSYFKKNPSALSQFDSENLRFGPSGIAVNPSGDIYIIASSGKVLLVFDQQKNLKSLEKIDKTIHHQPEGITFDNDGNLWISNEGKKGNPPQLLFFKMKEIKH